MGSNFHIASYIAIKNGSIKLNDELIYSNENLDFTAFMKASAMELKLNYPKFYKMDGLSKLSFLSADILIKDTALSNENIAIILSNKASSLETDRKHQRSIQDWDNYFPSPSVFVYTLPNIGIGEICIKHQLHSENSFFIFDEFNAKHLWINTESILKSNKADCVLCGWVELDGKNYEAFLYIVSKSGNIAHTQKEITRIFIGS